MLQQTGTFPVNFKENMDSEIEPQKAIQAQQSTHSYSRDGQKEHE